jgi:hypothetical protein
MQSHQSFETIQMFSLSIYIFCGNALLQFARNHAFIFYFFAAQSTRWKLTISASAPRKAKTRITVHALTANLSPAHTGFSLMLFSHFSRSRFLVTNLSVFTISIYIVQWQFVFKQTVQDTMQRERLTEPCVHKNIHAFFLADSINQWSEDEFRDRSGLPWSRRCSIVTNIDCLAAP